MIIWTPTVFSVLYARVLYFCICTCSAQLSMFHMERRFRNTLIVIIIMNYERQKMPHTKARQFEPRPRLEPGPGPPLVSPLAKPLRRFSV